MAAMALLTAGCGSTGDGGATQVNPARVVKSESDGEFQSTLKLDDGRQLQLRLEARTGLQIRHRAGTSGPWTGWRTVYRTTSDRCQGVESSAYHDTVAVIADFGTYCYDGEPPETSLAIVGTGDLTTWQVNVTKGFDGWARTAFAGEGSQVTFSLRDTLGLSSVVWHKGTGFGKARLPQSS
jgi:hypothetical protein